jgi:SAM-dependent methyltransferase
LTRILLEQTGQREIVGVDPDPAEAAQAKGLGIYATVHVGGGDRVPEEEGSFDWVLSNSVLEHVDAIEPVIAEVARVLRPGGQFVLTVPGPDFHKCLHGPVLPGVSREEYLRHLDARLAHLRYWDRQQWEAALNRSGMVIEWLSGYLSVAEVRRWESISRLTAGVLYGVGRGGAQPIEIQRRLGMRKSGRRMPAVVAAAVAAAMSAGLTDSSPVFGCLLIRASRGASAPTRTAERTG